MGKQIPLHDTHVELGAKIVDFSGWDMPVQYTNVMDEHKNTRNHAGLFDISHMGEFFIKGKDAKQFLQKIITNDINNLKEGKAFYTVMCNKDGGVIDDLFVYKFSDEKFMLVVNAGTIQKDFRHLMDNSLHDEVDLINDSDTTAKLDIQGPKAQKILQKLTDIKLEDLKRFEFIEDKVAGHPTIISRTGYTGEDGFELYFSADKATDIWNKIMEAGKEHNIKPVGLGARDTLRLESSYSLYGHELNDKTTPIEAGIGFVVKEKEENYIGKEILMKQKSEGTTKHIVCFEMIERSVPRDHYKVFKGEEEIGEVTSGTFSPTLSKGIGIAFVKEKLEIDTEISIKIREKLYKAKIAKRPFYEFKGGNKK